MGSDYFKHLGLFNMLDGLREGLTQFSGPSRAAVIYAETPEDPMRVCDPQDLLKGHEPKLIVVVVSADRPVSLIKSGVVLGAACEWNQPARYGVIPPTLEEWLNR